MNQTDFLSQYATSTMKRSKMLTLRALCAQLREQLMSRTLMTPYLMMMEEGQQCFPIYLDALDNGLELMLFQDTEAYERAILYSSHDDPDLLFTDACTIDFLFEDIKESELPLFDRHNLCYQLHPGKLPDGSFHQGFLISILTKLTAFLDIHHKLPILAPNEQLTIQGEQFAIMPYSRSQAITKNTSLMQSEHLSSYPHTNEHIYLMLQVQEDAQSPQAYRAVLHACNNHFQQSFPLSLQSLQALTEDIQSFLIQLCKQRGLMERLHLYSYNLYHIIHPICERLGIHCTLPFNQTIHMRLSNTPDRIAKELFSCHEVSCESEKALRS